MKRPLAVAALVSVLALAACGDDEAEPTTQTNPESAATAEPDQPEQDLTEPKPAGDGKAKGEKEEAKPGTEIIAAESQFGSILFNSEQQAIYLFDKETSSTSECYGACADAWPPVLTKGKPAAGDGIEAKLLGTTKRDDGSTQVTYAGQPLYYYVDEGPGEVLCHNVAGFGGLWLVLEPNGQAVS